MDYNDFMDKLKTIATLEVDGDGNYVVCTDGFLSTRRTYSLEKGEYVEKAIDEYDQAVLRALDYLVRGETLHYAVNIQAAFGHLDANKIVNLLLEEEFITDKLSEETFRTLSVKVTIPQLKNILKKQNLKLSGNKQEQVDRIIENVNFDEVDTEDYLGDGYKYIISDNGLDYYMENKYKLIYYNVLSDFDFDEYEKHYLKNRDNDVVIVAFEFLDKHEDKALSDKNHHYHEKVIQSKKKLLSLYDLPIEKSLENEIKIFSYNLNQGRYVSSKLDSKNISNLRKIYKKISEGYEKILLELYEKTTYPKEFSYEETLLLLEEVFKGSTMESIKKLIKNLKNNDTSKKRKMSKLDDYA